MQDNTALAYFAVLFLKTVVAGGLVNYFAILVMDTIKSNRRKRLARAENRR